MLRPCCFGISLQRGAKCVAIFDLVVSSAFAFSILTVLAIQWNESDKLLTTATAPPIHVYKGHLNPSLTGPFHGELYVLLLLFSFQLCLALTLYHGASTEKLKHLRIWWWARLILVHFFLLFDILDIVVREDRKLQYGICLQMSYQVYVLWLVKALMDDIRGIGPPRFTALASAATPNEYP